MVEYYIHQELINYAVEMNEKKAYDKAYEAFNKYVMLPDLPMMQDKKLQEKMPRDTNYYTYKYYAGRMAYQSQMYDEAMRIFGELVEGDIEAVSAGEFLYQCYIDLNDSVKANEVLDRCIQKFPAEPWFIQNRINNLVNSGSMEAAVEYLDKAIAADPQVQYFISKGSILNLQKKFDEAVATYEQALKVDPNNAAIYENYGFVYTDMANKMNDDAAYLNAKEYAKAKIEIDNTFRKALPYFEKAYELAPDNFEYKRSLRSLYYRLGEEEKYQQLAD
jgi:tetratricopeptide (TPR) repeat protein